MNSGSRSVAGGTSGTHALAPKMVIKPFKSQPKLPENYARDTWAKLETAVRAVTNKVSTSISKEELYRSVEDLCMHKFGSMVYENLHRECELHIFRQVDSLGEQVTC